MGSCPIFAEVAGFFSKLITGRNSSPTPSCQATAKTGPALCII